MNLTFKNVPAHILSATEIKTYCDCPRQRYYASRSCLAIKPKKPSNNLVLGKLIHQWLQSTYMQEEAISDEEVSTLLNFEDFKVYQTITRNYLPKALEDLEKYDVLECEYEFALDDYPINEVRYHGQIDMIVLEKGTNKLWFVEHKTCKDFRPNIYSRFDIQMHLYNTFGTKYAEEKGYEWQGILLNEIKKAKTSIGYDTKRTSYQFSKKECSDFELWLKKKTEGLISPENLHEPCNNYMTCRLCAYVDMCMKYGYELPESTQQVLTDFPDEYEFSQSQSQREIDESN